MVIIVGEHVSLDVKQTVLSDERNSAEVITRDQSRSLFLGCVQSIMTALSPECIFSFLTYSLRQLMLTSCIKIGE
jgi:hypothetical protein